MHCGTVDCVNMGFKARGLGDLLKTASSALVIVSPNRAGCVCHPHYSPCPSLALQLGCCIRREEGRDIIAGAATSVLGWHFSLNCLFTIQNECVAAWGSWLSTGIVNTAACRRQEIGNCISVPTDFTLDLSSPSLTHSAFLSVSFLSIVLSHLSVFFSKQLRSHASYLILTSFICKSNIYSGLWWMYFKHPCEFILVWRKQTFCLFL